MPLITKTLPKEHLVKDSVYRLYHRKSPDRDPKYLPSHSRTFGFYDSYNEEYKAVEENRGSMEECVYDYIVMEYIEAGIHPMVHATDWWAWDTNTRKWTYLSQDNWPTEFVGICNWALG